MALGDFFPRGRGEYFPREREFIQRGIFRSGEGYFPGGVIARGGDRWPPKSI